MKLHHWMELHGVKAGELAPRIGVSRQQVDRYCKGGQIPGKEIMPRIVEETKGAVGPVDFYPLNSRA